MEKFMSEAEDLVSLLMVLIHISNQPARATELFTLQIRNTSNVHRSFFATWGEVNWILGYSKVKFDLSVILNIQLADVFIHG
jgi:hypothetical protein